MKTKTGFRLTNVCGNNMLVAEGKKNIDYSYIISMNESAKLLWESVQGKDFEIDDLAQILVDNYELDDNKPLPFEHAKADAEQILETWKKVGLIE